jgi:drug/metabolite transporter (DMT)-like permease
VTAVLLGLGCSLAWGIADYLAGIASRRTHPAWAAAVSQGAGLLALLAAIAVLRDAPPATSDVLTGLAAGACGGAGLVAFYRGLAVGTMSLVAPISALGVVIPVAVGLAGGERPRDTVLLGMALAIVGIGLATRSRGRASRLGIGLAVAAAVGFGGFFALLGRAAEDDALWGATSARIASVALIALGAALARARPRARPGDLARIGTAGLLDAAAAAAFGLAVQRWPLSLVAVLASLYPVATVVLAHVRLGERLSPLQHVSVAALLAGVALIAAG